MHCVVADPDLEVRGRRADSFFSSSFFPLQFFYEPNKGAGDRP